jgi:hypothetical protein
MGEESQGGLKPPTPRLVDEWRGGVLNNINNRSRIKGNLSSV